MKFDYRIAGYGLPVARISFRQGLEALPEFYIIATFQWVPGSGPAESCQSTGPTLTDTAMF